MVPGKLRLVAKACNAPCKKFSICTKRGQTTPSLNMISNLNPTSNCGKSIRAIQYVSICFIMFHALLLELSRPSTHVQQLHLAMPFANSLAATRKDCFCRTSGGSQLWWFWVSRGLNLGGSPEKSKQRPSRCSICRKRNISNNIQANAASILTNYPFKKTGRG